MYCVYSIETAEKIVHFLNILLVCILYVGNSERKTKCMITTDELTKNTILKCYFAVDLKETENDFELVLYKDNSKSMFLFFIFCFHAHIHCVLKYKPTPAEVL